jgi:hypothetical protein
MNDEYFMALAEGLSALSMLESLELLGCVLLAHHSLNLMSLDWPLSKNLKQEIEEAKKVHWPLLKKIAWI